MSVSRRSPIALPAGVYDEIVSEALETRLAELEQTHAFELAEVKNFADPGPTWAAPCQTSSQPLVRGVRAPVA